MNRPRVQITIGALAPDDLADVVDAFGTVTMDSPAMGTFRAVTKWADPRDHAVCLEAFDRFRTRRIEEQADHGPGCDGPLNCTCTPAAL